MHTIELKGKTYELDADDFLVHSDQWDEDFAEGMAPTSGIEGGLTEAHWKVLRYIRDYYLENGTSPLVYKTCRKHRLRAADLEKLFPSGYQRGACKLAGLSFLAEDIKLPCSTAFVAEPKTVPISERVYRTNAAGYLVDPSEWDEDFAALKMVELKMPPITDRHCQVIQYLRAEFARTGKVPTVYETCAANNMDIEELGELFPDGYHRGAVKVAGLR